MKSKLNYKSKKTIIITVVIILLLALSGTGIYVFTKGNDSAKALTESNILESSSKENIQETRENIDEVEQTVEPNIGSENSTNKTNIQQNETIQNNEVEANNTATTQPSTNTKLPNQEYTTERQEEVEKLVYEGFLVGWTPVQLSTIADNIEINKEDEQPAYTISKVATLVNGKELIKDDEGKVTTKVSKNDKITYVITVENTGNVTLQEIKVTDELIGFEDKISILAIGDKKEITVEYIVNENDMDENENITNVVIATVTNPTDPEKEIIEKDQEIVPVNPYITISGTKTWVDNNNEDNTRPENITIKVLEKDKVVDTMEVSEADDGTWTYTSKELLKYDSENNEINYTVSEDKVDKYTTTLDGNNFINTIAQDNTVSILGTKTWVDPQGTVHPTITINLLQDGTEISETTLTNGNTSYSFTNLDKYNLEDGHIYKYTVTEDIVEGYTSVQNDNNFINTIAQDSTISITGTKTWIDPQGTIHPAITINLLRDTVKVDEITLTNGNVDYSFENLDKYDLKDGHIYIYTVSENPVIGYTMIQNGNDFTNTINQEKITVSGTKTWIDPQGTVHPTITINLLRDGTEITEKTLINGVTEYSFTELDKYAPDGHIYNYTVTEDEVSGYITVQNETDFTNTIAQVKIEVNGTKTWIDPEGTTHPTIKINLLKDNQKIAEKTLKNGTTSYTFDNLDKYDLTDGHVYNYTVTENAVAGYTTIQNGNNFTNTINQEKVNVTGTKTWIDPIGTIHSTITINLFKDGTKVDSQTLPNGTTAYSFTNLDKYAPDGHIYSYTVTENAVAGYTTTQDGNNFTNTINQEKVTVSGTKKWVDPEGTLHPTITINLLRDGSEISKITLENGVTTYSFTNLDKYAPDGHIYNYTVTEDAVDGYTMTQVGNNFTNTINQDNTISVSGTKTWIDPVGTLHPTITINLLRDNEEVKETTLTNGTTTYSFTNLEKYAPDGHIYNYTVTEDAVEGYTTLQVGNNFTNTIAQAKVEVSGTKTWIDPVGTIHKNITIELLRDGIKVNSTTLVNRMTEYTFRNLDKYAPDGHMYKYTVREVAVEGYTTVQDGTNFTNTINQEKINVNGTKTWVDPVGTTHPTITINLLKDGTKVDSTTLTNGTTTYSFTNLDKYAPDGHIYNYTVTEDAVAGYTTLQVGNNFTNTIAQAKVEVSGTKTWVDPTGTTHPTITIDLLRDNTKVSETTLTNGTTTYSFTNLDKYAPDGHIYKYTVKEVTVEGYTTVQDGTNFTNTINQEKINVNGTKTWVDPVGTMHPTITINLLKDGTKVDSKTLTNGTTTYSFTSLDKYAPDGHIYNYTVTENAVKGYTTVQSGNNFTNTIKQDSTISISGTKTWIDPVGTVHPTITINLLRDGNEIDEKTLTNGVTTYSFKNLDKYDLTNGHIYNYTVTEDTVEGYTSVQTGNNFTNTINQAKVDVRGTKTWINTPEGTINPTITINLLRDGNEISEKTLTNGNTSYSFTNLDKYDLTTGKEYVYTVSEDAVKNYSTSYDGNNITNTFRQEIAGTVTVTTTSTSTTEVSNPLDVVFVLDVSGSMKEDNKASNMVSAVNSAMATIMKKNANSRIGIVAFSENSTTLLSLNTYNLKTNGKYLTYNDTKITTNINGISNRSVDVNGGTFTQSGIKAGAELLTSVANTTYTQTVDGKTITSTRTPVIILLSDGDPTYYATNYTTLNNKDGNGRRTTENEAYYTIRTADYYKKQVTSHYYGSTATKSKFYTIGLGMDGTLSKTILNPTTTNVNNCDKEGTDKHWVIEDTRNTLGKLYDKIIADGGKAGAYSYADASYVGKMTTTDLEAIFNQIITNNSTSTSIRDITLEESNARKVELTGIDTSKAFSLMIAGKTYSTLNSAISAGYVKQNVSSGYYVDLSKLTSGSTVQISYNK